MYYSGKKKRHTLKTQVVVEKKSRKIVCTSFCNGKKHDFKLFKDSNVKLQAKTSVIADSGYTGIDKIHKNSYVPKKSSKKQKLNDLEKKENRRIARERIPNENVIGCLKRFKIICERYRNRRKRFCLRFNLISGIYNHELSSSDADYINKICSTTRKNPP